AQQDGRFYRDPCTLDLRSTRDRIGPAGRHQGYRQGFSRSIEMLGTIAGPEPAQRAARHYSQCIVRSHLTASQLASFLPEYVRARPELRGSSVQSAMNDYLKALCGRPID